MTKHQVGTLIGIGIFALLWISLTPAFVQRGGENPPALMTASGERYYPPVEDTLAMMSPERLAEFAERTDAMRNKVLTASDEMPQAGRVTARANFNPRAHEAKGSALLIETSQGTLLRFENFETVNGPDLRVHLSSGLGGADIVDLGPLRATQGNVNYIVPEGIDTEHYRYVLVWSEAYDVLFSYAQL